MNFIAQLRLFVAVAAATCLVGCGRSASFTKTPEVAKVSLIRDALVGPGGADAGDAAASTSTGWGTLKGRLTYAGDPPQMPPMSEALKKDPATCAPGGKPPQQQFLLVDSGSKGIANIVLFARKVSRVHESAGPKTEPFVFNQKNCIFRSHVFAVTVGQPLDIKNSDDVSHNTNISGQNGFNQMIGVGESTETTPKKEESAPVEVGCNVHPWMRAYMLPRKNGYFAVTAADGSFEIPNLPAGEKLEIQVWHERAAGGKSNLFIDTPEAKALKWSDKGRFILQLESDETKDIQLAVPESAFSI